MYLPDHNPPHFHVRYNEYRATIDCQPLINQYKLFAPLRDKEVFAHFTLDGWTVTWLDGTVDIAPEHLYEHGIAA